MSATAGEPLCGPAAEARRLVEALGDWASTRLGPADDHLATSSPECQVCPLCQLISLLRGDRPEVLARLGDAWAAFLAVLVDHAHPPAPSPTPAPSPSSAPEPDVESPIRPVQNIDVR